MCERLLSAAVSLALFPDFLVIQSILYVYTQNQINLAISDRFKKYHAERSDRLGQEPQDKRKVNQSQR